MKKNTLKRTERSSALSSEKDALACYLTELQKIPLMSREEEEITARKAAKGDEAARNKLVNANLRFVVKIAKKYRGMGLPLEDLINEGNIGLLNAVKGYDVDKGYHFISYAVWWIRHHIQKAVCEKARLIRLPQNKVDSLLKIDVAKKMIQTNQNEKAELLEIARLVNMDVPQVLDLLRLGQDPVFLGTPVCEDPNAVSLEELIEDESRLDPEDNAINKLLQDDIESVLGTLKKREADIIRARYGLGSGSSMSLEEAGDIYAMSKEGIRQIETKAMQRLRMPSRRRRLEAYVA